jgi:hypothetical protein
MLFNVEKKGKKRAREVERKGVIFTENGKLL